MARMTEHDMIGWFNAAPTGSRQQRMLWAARKIARLTGATEGGVYQMLERSFELRVLSSTAAPGRARGGYGPRTR